jgi:NhaP-type Na+/H+ or K+/H+ antiporter
MPLIEIAVILILGVAAQWLAWRVRLPSIVLLLIFGFTAGPLTGFLEPDALFGDLLEPLVSLSVAVILFEGGLTLRLKELREFRGVFLRLILLGIFLTWGITTAAAHLLLHINLSISVLLGVILVVTGPTVIGPLLRNIRPSGRIGNLLKWEGIIIDPAGAILAVLVFEMVFRGGTESAVPHILWGLGKTVLSGGILGFGMAYFLIFLIKKYWIPDYLQESVTLFLVVAAFVLSNLIQAESGLFTVTLMGIILANQEWVPIQDIVEFKENLRVLIISVLFIILSARLDLSYFGTNILGIVILLGALVFAARPLTAFLSTVGRKWSWRERIFLSWMAPRGIVAAAVSSIFAIRLSEAGFPQAEALVSFTFAVIVGTVFLYSLTAPPLARRLKLAQTNPQGVLIVGAHDWALCIAKTLQKQQFRVVMVDTNRQHVNKSRMQGVPAYHGNVLSKQVVDKIPLEGIGKLLALTSNNEANCLAALNFEHVFEKKELYQIAPEESKSSSQHSKTPVHLRGRYLFSKEITYAYLSQRFNRGAQVKATTLSEEFDYEQFQARYGRSAIPLFLIPEDGSLHIITHTEEMTPKPGQTIIALVDEAGD